MEKDMTNTIIKDFTKKRENENLTPWQVTGITDAEGSFSCSIFSRAMKGKTVKLEFKVTQKSHSEGILYELQEYFGCGNVVIDNNKTNTKKYQVTGLSSILNKIIPHFDSYHCITSKFLNFKDWKKIALIMESKEHLTLEGLIKITEISSKMNKERSFEEKYYFCQSHLGVACASKSNGDLEIEYNLPSEWLQTFLTGEGMFYTYLGESKSRGKSYLHCDSSLEIGQNNHDIAILLAIQKFFKGGYIKPKYKYNNIDECLNSRSVNRYICRDVSTIINFVDQYPMLTTKHLDYLDWKKIVELKNKGFHKTEEGLSLINQIISKMNSKRENNSSE